ncbi:antirestriction protein ArdC [Neorhizobium galegae]|nr:antirestriction protein ArdC [Neorhizobium galegae]
MTATALRMRSARGFASPKWMTFKQSLELSGAVRKGETGSTVVFASRFTKSEAPAVVLI